MSINFVSEQVLPVASLSDRDDNQAKPNIETCLRIVAEYLFGHFAYQLEIA